MMQQEVFTTDHVIGKKGHILVVQTLTGKIYMGMLISHYISLSANVRLLCSYHCNRKNFLMQKKAFTTDHLTGKKGHILSVMNTLINVFVLIGNNIFMFAHFSWLLLSLLG